MLAWQSIPSMKCYQLHIFPHIKKKKISLRNTHTLELAFTQEVTWKHAGGVAVFFLVLKPMHRAINLSFTRNFYIKMFNFHTQALCSFAHRTAIVYFLLLSLPVTFEAHRVPSTPPSSPKRQSREVEFSFPLVGTHHRAGWPLSGQWERGSSPLKIPAGQDLLFATNSFKPDF